MIRRTTMRLVVAVAAAALLGGPVAAQEKGSSEEEPYAQPDDTWIQISGTVEEVTPDSFTLDYGDGVITVEMDDADREAEAYTLLEGDKVSVSGLIDDDFYETAKIEASSVYIEKLGTRFYASSVDEEDDFTVVMTPIDVSDTTIQGTVTKVKKDSFVVNTGLRSVTVEVGSMAYDPLDETGYQEVEVGDVVRVNGTMDDDFFESKRLEAETVTTLVE